MERIEGFIFEILDLIPMSVVIADAKKEGKPLIYVNNFFLNMFGYTKEEVLGRNCSFLQGEKRDSDYEIKHSREIIRDALARNVPVTKIIKNYTKSGKIVYNEVFIFPIFEKNSKEPIYYVGFQKDVTKQKLLEDELEREREEVRGDTKTKINNRH